MELCLDELDPFSVSTLPDARTNFIRPVGRVGAASIKRALGITSMDGRVLEATGNLILVPSHMFE